MLAWALYWLGCSQTGTVLLVLCHWSCFLCLLSNSHLSSGLFPVDCCWRLVSKTREQSSSSLDSPGWKDYFTHLEGFSSPFIYSMLFAFILMVFTVDWLSAYDPDLPLQNVYWDSGVTILDVGTDVFPIACSAVPLEILSAIISLFFLWLMERKFYYWTQIVDQYSFEGCWLGW